MCKKIKLLFIKLIITKKNHNEKAKRQWTCAFFFISCINVLFYCIFKSEKIKISLFVDFKNTNLKGN
jgi:dipeptide/tripeptide permease